MIWAVPKTEPSAVRTPSTARIRGSRAAGTGWRSASETVFDAAHLHRDALVGGVEDVVEGPVDGVAEDERADHEPHPEDDRERGEDEPQLARQQVPDRLASDHEGGPLRERLHVIEDRFRRGLLHPVHDAPVGQEQHPVGLAGGRRLVGDHDDRLAELVRRPAHEREQLGRRLGVELAGGLVGEDDVGAGGQRPRRGDPLLLAAGELGRPMAQPVAEVERVDRPGPATRRPARARRCPGAGGCSRAR